MAVELLTSFVEKLDLLKARADEKSVEEVVATGLKEEMSQNALPALGPLRYQQKTQLETLLVKVCQRFLLHRAW